MTGMSVLDYFLPKIVFKTHSDYNGEVKVVKVMGATKLIFGGGVQSLKYDSPNIGTQYWGQAVKLIKDSVKDAKSILVLGLGGGTIQHFLAKAYPGVEITSVEIDPVVIEVAKKYFDLDAIPNHKVLQANCFELLKDPKAFNLQKEFDVILVDINEKGLFSKVPVNTDFLKHISDLSVMGGFVAFNFIVSKNDGTKGTDLLNIIRDYFSGVTVLKVKNVALADNWLIYGRNKS